MSVTDRERRHVFTMLERTLGLEAAESIMQLLPFQSSTDLATRSDLNATTVLLQGQMVELGSDLQGQMAELRSDLQGQMAELRSDLQGQMAELRSDLQGQMAELRAELRGEMAEIRGEMGALRGELKGEFQRWIAVGAAANAIAVVTALIT